MNYRHLVFCFTLLVLTGLKPADAIEVGAKAPDCVLSSINDTQKHALKDFYGQKLFYIDFWASWCLPCSHSFSFLNDINQDLKDKGLQVLGINIDQGFEDSKAFLAKNPANFTVLSDIDAKCVTAFDVKVMPSSYLVDRQGIVRYIHFGFRAGDVDELRKIVDQLLADKA